MKNFFPLREQEILNALPLVYHDHFQFYIHDTIHSTNQFLKELTTASPKIQCCIAEMQTAGRGRSGKHWFSPYGENIYFSIKTNLKTHHPLSGLSLVIGLAVVAMLKQSILQQPLIKWPNDILIEQKKCSGILLESVGDHIIIGIGINVNSELPKESPDPYKPWCSLFQVTGQLFDRNLLIASLLTQLIRYLECFTQNGLIHFIKEWETLDFLKGKQISISNFNQKMTGVSRGINEYGYLIFEDFQGEMHQLTSGDTSLLTFL